MWKSWWQAKRRWGFIALAVWLVLTGLAQFVSLDLPSFDKILAGLAIVAGVLILLDR